MPTPPPNQRRKIRVTGKEALADVARAIYGDIRLATLLTDLNPALPSATALPKDTVVTCPSKVEAAAFAKKMGFTLGFNEVAGNGTAQKRAWSKMQGPGQAPRDGVLGVEAAKTLLAQGLPPQEVGKRLVKLLKPNELDAVIANTEPALANVRLAAEMHHLYPLAHVRMTAVLGVLDATLRPSGTLHLFEAYEHNAAAIDKLLSAIVVGAPLRDGLREAAPELLQRVRKAQELAKLERGAKDGALATAKDAALSALCAAVVDGVPLLAGDRLRLLGIDEIHAALHSHITKVVAALKKQLEVLGQSSVEVLRTVGKGGEGKLLPKPWPLVCGVVGGLMPTMEGLAVNVRDDGVGGMVRKTPTATKPTTPMTSRPSDRLSTEGAAVVQASDLIARAASGARTVDEGTAAAERVAPLFMELFRLARPNLVDTGAAPKRQQRNAFFLDAMTAKSPASATGVASLVTEVFDDAKRTQHPGIDRIQRAQVAAALMVGKALSSAPLSVQQRPLSELGRALLVCAMSLDRDFGLLLSRPTGKEAFQTAAEKQAAKIISKAGLLYVDRS
jgi:hypothetical protein